MLLWNLDPRNQILTSANVIPLMLQIWKHILKSEEVLDELKKDKTKDVAPPATAAAAAATTTTTTATTAAAATVAAAATPTGTAAPAPAASVDPELEEVGVDNLNRLIDMGFSRAMSIRALRISSTVEQATEYLLSAPSIVINNQPGICWC
jgi:UBA/TS-N domain